jgi:hypothetical protein
MVLVDQKEGDRKQEKKVFLLMEECFFLTYFLIGGFLPSL